MGRISSEIDKRDEQQLDRAGLEAKIKGAHDWFKSVVPSHIDPDQFVALCLGAIRKNHDLQQAAIMNPASFMVAASDCARMGLVPGETFHFVAFNNRETGVPDVTGIVDYKGEIDMIYRAGGVMAVHCQVVRKGDHFVWRPGMEIPEHVIPENEDGQVGLADESDRGPLTGVYAYARLLDGGVSEPIVMSRSEVMKHKKAAKSKKFWDGDWEPDMWLKTAVHKLYDRVPHSQEYLRERLRAENAPPIPGAERPAVGTGALALPSGGSAGPRQPGEASRNPDGYADDDPGRWPAGAVPAAPPAAVAPSGDDERRAALTAVYDLFTAWDLAADEYAPQRCALLAAAGAPEGADPLPITKPVDLNAHQATQAAQVLAQLVATWQHSGDDVRANLLAEAARAREATAAQQATEQAPAAESRAPGGRGRRAAKGSAGDDAS